MLTDKVDLAFVEAAGPQLKVVSTMSVGFDHIDVDLLKQSHIKIGNTPGVLTDATADIAVMLTLAAARRAKEGAHAVIAAKWGVWDPNWLLGTEFKAKTLGIVGLGRIGTAAAARLIGLGFSTVLYSGSSRHPHEEEALSKLGRAFNAFHDTLGSASIPFECRYVSTDQIIAESDVVLLCCALTQQTRHLININNISHFKKSAILVNPARGPIIDPKALLFGLENHCLFAAGLDVTDPEPISSTDPLAVHPRCFIMPHLGSATVETREAMASLALENVLGVILGNGLTHAV